MGQNVYLSQLRSIVQNQTGVITVSDIVITNKVGGQYSSSQTSQKYLDLDTREIDLIDETIFAEPSQTYQVRFSNKDINVRVKNLKTVNFT